jgi:hypothetical protein
VPFSATAASPDICSPAASARFPSPRVLGAGLAALGAAGTVLVLLATTSGTGLPWIASALFLTARPVGLILPITTALCGRLLPPAVPLLLCRSWHLGPDPLAR